MTVYFDSSALVAVYVTEAYSARARRELRKHGRIPWTPLHDLEVRNALRLLHGRRQIDEAELHGLLEHVDDDLRRGHLARPAIDLGAAFRRADDELHPPARPHTAVVVTGPGPLGPHENRLPWPPVASVMVNDLAGTNWSFAFFAQASGLVMRRRVIPARDGGRR